MVAHQKDVQTIQVINLEINLQIKWSLLKIKFLNGEIGKLNTKLQDKPYMPKYQTNKSVNGAKTIGWYISELFLFVEGWKPICC